MCAMECRHGGWVRKYFLLRVLFCLFVICGCLGKAYRVPRYDGSPESVVKLFSQPASEKDWKMPKKYLCGEMIKRIDKDGRLGSYFSKYAEVDLEVIRRGRLKYVFSANVKDKGKTLDFYFYLQFDGVWKL